MAKTATKASFTVAEIVTALKSLRSVDINVIMSQAAEIANEKRNLELAEIKALFAQKAEEIGVDINDLFGGKGKKARKSSANGRYVNPLDPTKTWAGLGRRPAWVSDALASGKTLNDLAA